MGSGEMQTADGGTTADTRLATTRDPVRRPTPRTHTRRGVSRKTAGVKFRGAEPADAAAIAEVHVLAWQATYRGMIPDAHLDALSVAKGADNWRQLLADFDPPRSGALVALDDAQLLGFASFCATRDLDAALDVGEISAIYVRPDHWRRGIGRTLLQLAVDSLDEAGCSSATLWVLDSNTRAREFYETAGWMPDGVTKEDERSGFTLHEVRYSKSLHRSA